VIELVEDEVANDTGFSDKLPVSFWIFAGGGFEDESFMNGREWPLDSPVIFVNAFVCNIELKDRGSLSMSALSSFSFIYALYSSSFLSLASFACSR